MITKENAKEYLPLIQALAEGKTVQVNGGTKENPRWEDPNFGLVFDNKLECYRIKPEPRTFYVLEYFDGVFSEPYSSQSYAEGKRNSEQVLNESLGRKEQIKILTLKEIL